MLVDRETLLLLDRMAVAPRGPSADTWPEPGLRRSTRSGASPEFSDFRAYSPGDDYRRIDWKAYARLERLFLRLYHTEENLAVHLLLDTSGSMAWGEPPKSLLAARVAAALAYLALANYDRLSVACLGQTMARFLPPLAGREAVWRAWEFLEQATTQGRTDLNRALADFCRRKPGPGIAVVITDLLAPGGYAQGIAALQGAGLEVAVLRVLAPQETKPDLSGEWRLVDCEDGSALEVSVTPSVLAQYMERLRAHREEVASFCSRRGVAFAELTSDLSMREALARLQRETHLIR